jgi:rSAM/selenodomain-associated transferase 1
MQPFYPDTAIILFAREPILGKVKTRLIPVLGVNNAARLYDQMLRHTINTVVDIDLAAIYLYITPESDPQYFHSMALKNNFQLRIQQGNNLGVKMFNALDQTLKQYKRAVLIGTDCPFLDADDLNEAIISLDTAQPHKNTMVFSPAQDGGYVLVGASRVCQEVFQDIEWGTEKVMSQTRSVLEYKQIQWRELNKQQDIDTCEDLSALSQLKGFRQWSSYN